MPALSVTATGLMAPGAADADAEGLVAACEHTFTELPCTSPHSPKSQMEAACWGTTVSNFLKGSEVGHGATSCAWEHGRGHQSIL